VSELETINLRGTSVVTTIVGFGCARLFRLPRPADREVLLETALECGIRHFDVAPMYGLGLAESLVGSVLKPHRDVITITTKFGIDVTKVGRGLSRVQGPIRGLISRRAPAIGSQVERAGQGPSSGWSGRLLYSTSPFRPRAAEHSLKRSLAALDTDHVDCFLLHEPVSLTAEEANPLADFLDAQQEIGRIRCWGVAGPPAVLERLPSSIVERSHILQVHDDMLGPPPPTAPHAATISYGVLGGTLGLVQQFFSERPTERQFWSNRLETDLDDPQNLPVLLLRHAIARNSTGPVLFSSTVPARVRLGATAADPASTALGARQTPVMDELLAFVSQIDAPGDEP
jgi:D-threo-aldose 1-dehydrogenase